MRNLGFTFRLPLGISMRRHCRPGDDLEPSIRVLRNRGAAFHPIATIDVGYAEIVVDDGMMDMTANHAVSRMSSRLDRQSFLKFTDVIDGVFDLVLCPLGE